MGYLPSRPAEPRLVLVLGCGALPDSRVWSPESRLRGSSCRTFPFPQLLCQACVSAQEPPEASAEGNTHILCWRPGHHPAGGSWLGAPGQALGTDQGAGPGTSCGWQRGGQAPGGPLHICAQRGCSQCVPVLEAQGALVQPEARVSAAPPTFPRATPPLVQDTGGQWVGKQDDGALVEREAGSGRFCDVR